MSDFNDTQTFKNQNMNYILNCKMWLQIIVLRIILMTTFVKLFFILYSISLLNVSSLSYCISENFNNANDP